MSAVYSTVPISTVTDIQDFLLNYGAAYVSPWKVEVRLFRANLASFGDEGKSKSLFTIWASHDSESIWTFGPQESGVKTSTTILPILESKLRSLWTPRQTFKGDGQTYSVDDGSFIRLSNVLVQGNYKGLLLDADASPESQKLFHKVVEHFGLEKPTEEVTTDPRERARLFKKVYR